MAKRPDITTIASGYYSRQALNNNFENLRDKFDNTLSLDGSTPNAMGADLDLNGNNIIGATGLLINGTDYLVDIEAAKAAALVAQAAAELAETNAETAESNAEASETASATSATNAASSASAASSSASAAASSASAASTSETNAETAETGAQASATAAATSETNAAASETNAATSAANAATSESNAASSASSAQASKDAALAALDSFDDRYLGQKASDPTVDNDGDALVAGALYFNTTDEIMKVYDGSLWVAAYASLSGAMFGANNLSDVASSSASRLNLGLTTVAATGDYTDLTNKPTLGTAATTDSTDYATAAQGSLADSALQDGDTVASLTLTSADINGGSIDGTAINTSTIDGTVIGGSTPAAGTFTALTSTGIDDNATSTAITIDSSQNVGIGTSSPSYYSGKLTVAGGNISIEGGNRALFWNTTGSGVASIEGTGTNELSFSTGLSTERMRITSTGNVGIGTTSPSELLHVYSNGGDSYISVDATGAWSGIRFQDTGTTKAAFYMNHGGSYLRTDVNGSERMRIDSSGNVLIGCTATPSATVAGSAFIKTAYDNELRLSSSLSNGNQLIAFLNPNGQVGSIATNGSATLYNTSSDYRLKTDVQPMTGASARVQSLKPCNFAWKADGSRTDGFLAHEAQAVVPEAVTGEKDGEEMQAIDQSKLVPLLTAALQEALTEIDALKTRITALEG